jgi:hypothetical protein
MKKIIVLIIGFLMVVVSLSGCTDVEDDIDGDDNDSNDPGGSGWTEEGLAIDNGWYWNPEVVQLDDGSYRMYVEDHGDDGSSLIGIIALSSSDGFNWSYEGIVMAAASHPGVIKLSDGRWKLYYQCGEGICSAISNDGLTFEQEDGVRLESDVSLEGANVRHPCIVSLPEDGYRVYYDTDAEDGAFIRIWSAYSEDGLNFTRDGLNIDLTSYRDDWPTNFYAHSSKPEVIKTPDGKWRMFFASSPLVGSVFKPAVIRMATSTDGTHWDVKTDNYEISAGEKPDGKFYGTFDVSVQLIESGSESIVRMWYCLFLSPEEGFVGDYSGIYSVSKPLNELDD